MEMECVVTDAPSDCTLFTGGGGLVCLALDAEIHDMISADSAVVNNDIPRPKGNCVPLLDLEALLAFSDLVLSISGFLGNRGTGRIGHVDISHDGS